MRRVIRAALLVAVVFGIAACSSSMQGSPSRKSSSQHASGTTASTPSATTAQGGDSRPADGITGIGATDAAWNAHHTAAPRFLPGAVYDRDPSVNPISGNGYRYVAVLHGDGRVYGYSMEFPTATPRTVALSEVANELPPDARIVWQRAFDVCYQVQFKSATLARAMPDTHGGVSAGLYHYDSGANSLPDTSHVEEAILLTTYDATPSAASAC